MGRATENYKKIDVGTVWTKLGIVLRSRTSKIKNCGETEATVGGMGPSCDLRVIGRICEAGKEVVSGHKRKSRGGKCFSTRGCWGFRKGKEQRKGNTVTRISHREWWGATMVLFEYRSYTEDKNTSRDSQLVM